jgi:hypothetical protein
VTACPAPSQQQNGEEFAQHEPDGAEASFEDSTFYFLLTSIAHEAQEIGEESLERYNYPVIRRQRPTLPSADSEEAY